jgi:hypothetical protein
VVNGTTPASVDITVTGGTFSGGGTVGGDLLFNGAATFAPGDNLLGILLIEGNLSLDAASTAAFGLAHGGGAAPIAGNDYAQVRVGAGAAGTGAVALNNAGLSLTLGTGILENDLFFLILNDAVDPITGRFAGLEQDGLFMTGGQLFQISYAASFEAQSFLGGNDIALMAVPEPGSLLLIAGGFVLCAASRRRGRMAD